MASWILLLSWILLHHQWGSSGCPYSSVSSWGRDPSDDGSCPQRSHSLCADIQVDKQHFRQTNWITIEWLETNKQKKSWMFIILYTCQPSIFSYLDLQSRTKCISYSALNSGITKSMANYSHAASSGPDVFNRVVCSFLLNLVNIFGCSY